jgi:hypothetical protein
MALGLTQPLVQWVPGALFPGIKQPRREINQSPPSSAKVKNAWSCTSTLPYFFMTRCLIKYLDVTFYVLLQYAICSVNTYQRLCLQYK